ncbi:uncharacterized protein FOMMEDRAFT_160119 [Fomitiporia mediterranea MF3/22]|uniref:uncharacterized protein n=1 Tax=Fomitiporia mediterranea (strain MF3/22) TaxID=694068 RepID=UPI0004409C8A|nr:uncharacterized protein FOMMEDRAFT_160119 [Fomitiporia mediterranea MF3/22]EJC99694.1 hypothetical protein FOMMEDRAFT_160119 [Fomitiporia mediterranea MF3/22]
MPRATKSGCPRHNQGAAAHITNTIKDGIDFVEVVKACFKDAPEVYSAFLSVLHERWWRRITELEEIRRILALFWGHGDILRRYNDFLHEVYFMEFTNEVMETMTSIRIATPQGMVVYLVEDFYPPKEHAVFHPDTASIIQNISPIIQSSVAALPRNKYSNANT